MAEKPSQEELKKLITKLEKNTRIGSRAEAAKALGRHEEYAKDAVPSLVKAMKKDPSERVRGRAALALGRIDDPSAVDDLIEVLENDKNLVVRSRAAWALGDLGANIASKAIEPLSKASDLPKNKEREFYFKISLMKLAGLESDAYDYLCKQKENKELETWQIIRFNSLYKELSLQQKVNEASKGIADVKNEAKTVETEVESLKAKVEQQEEGQMKTDLLQMTNMLQNMVNNQQRTIERQEETISSLNEALQDLVKAHQKSILEPRITAEQYHEFRDEKLKEPWIKRNFFALLGAIGTLISSVVAILGWLSSVLGWIK